MFLYRNEQIRQFESYLIDNHIRTEKQLMEAAAQAVLTQLQHHWPTVRKIAIVCGKGKNGGDGYILASLAQQRGLVVCVYALVPLSSLSGLAQQNAQAARNAGVLIKEEIPSQFDAEVIVDAILGSGLHGEVNEPFASAIRAINLSALPVLSIDVPSGIEADTGCVVGCAVQATLTVTFMGIKQGLLTHQALSCCGKMVVDSLNIDEKDLKNLSPAAESLEQSQINIAFSKRVRSSSKGDYGHVLVIGGDHGMGGAVRMAAEAAMRVGAGLVTVATRPEHVNIVAGICPELMCHPITDIDHLEPLLAKATVLVVGPGLGKSVWSRSLMDRIFAQNGHLSVKLPMIVDADALNLLSEKSAITYNNWILTPHPGEASRLLGWQIAKVQADRFQAAQSIQRRYGGIVVLKGAGSIVESPDDLPAVCAAGNPGMASGGMGDLLSGILGGLVAQHLPLSTAARIGVLIHALAADLAAEDGGERGLVATDLIPYLRRLVNPLQSSDS